MLDRHFTMVSKNDCIWCDKAKRLLESKGFTYQELNIDDEPEYKKILIQESYRTVPLIFEGPVRIGGYSQLFEYLSDT